MAKKVAAITLTGIKKSEDGDDLWEGILAMAATYGVPSTTVLGWLEQHLVDGKTVLATPFKEELVPMFQRWVDKHTDRDAGQRYL
jgi:hypothetical protein